MKTNYRHEWGNYTFEVDIPHLGWAKIITSSKYTYVLKEISFTGKSVYGIVYCTWIAAKKFPVVLQPLIGRTGQDVLKI